LINRQLGIKKRDLTAIFVDLKAAFDSMEAMREREIRKGLIEKVE